MVVVGTEHLVGPKSLLELKRQFSTGSRYDLVAISKSSGVQRQRVDCDVRWVRNMRYRIRCSVQSQELLLTEMRQRRTLERQLNHLDVQMNVTYDFTNPLFTQRHLAKTDFDDDGASQSVSGTLVSEMQEPAGMGFGP